MFVFTGEKILKQIKKTKKLNKLNKKQSFHRQQTKKKHLYRTQNQEETDATKQHKRG